MDTLLQLDPSILFPRTGSDTRASSTPLDILYRDMALFLIYDVHLSISSISRLHCFSSVSIDCSFGPLFDTRGDEWTPLNWITRYICTSPGKGNSGSLFDIRRAVSVDDMITPIIY